MKLSINIDWGNVAAAAFWLAVVSVPFISGYIVYQLDKAEFRANLTVNHPVPEPLTTYCHWLDDESGFVCVTQTASQMLQEPADVY